MSDVTRISDQFLSQRKDLRDVDVKSDWILILTEDEIAKFVQKIAAQIDAKFEGQEIVLVCLLKGCVYFFVDLTRQLTIPYSTYFVEASSYHNEQTQSETVEILSRIVPSKFNGKTVVLVDELYDNGTTISSVKQKLVEDPALDLTADRIYTCVLLQKKKKKNMFPGPDFVGCASVPDVWLVGYGLDDQQEKRGWVHLFACPKCAGVPKTEDDEVLFSDVEALAAERKRLLAQLTS